MYSTNKNEIPFKEIVDDLLNNDKPFPGIHLHRFSDIHPNELREIKMIWADILPARKQSLLEDLVILTDADTLVSFCDFALFTISDENPAVRTRSIHLLFEYQENFLAPIFINIADTDEDETVRAAAAIALAPFVYMGELEEIPQSLFEKIQNCLIGKLEGNETEQVKQRSLEALGFSSNKKVIKFITEALKKETLPWITSAVIAMGRSADKRWENEVLYYLDHEELSIQIEAVRAAGELTLKSARQPLLELVPTPEFEDEIDLRMAVIWSLSEIGGDNVAAVFKLLLEKCEEIEEAEFIEDAIENLTLTEGIMSSLDMFEIDYPDEDDGDLIF